MMFYRDKARFDRVQRMLLNGEYYDFTPCTYCGLPATDREHVIPKTHAAVIAEMGLVKPQHFLVVPACKECNILAGRHVFPTITEKHAYLHRILRKRYQKYLDIPVWTEEKFREMSKGLIGMIRRRIAIQAITKRRLLWPQQSPY